jgi:hypothetical protein
MNNNMKINKMKSLSMNQLSTGCTLIGFLLLLLLSFMVLPLDVNAAVDIDTSGDGRAAAFDVTVKDKNSGSPISDAYVTLDINPPSSTSFETSSAGTAVAAAGIASNEEIIQEKATQVMHTDNNGHATFTVEVGPKSDLGVYDTELEVTKDSYQSSFEQIDFRIA